MNKITNPFLIYGYAGPDYFCDRKEDTQKLISARPGMTAGVER